MLLMGLKKYDYDKAHTAISQLEMKMREIHNLVTKQRGKSGGDTMSWYKKVDAKEMNEQQVAYGISLMYDEIEEVDIKVDELIKEWAITQTNPNVTPAQRKLIKDIKDGLGKALLAADAGSRTEPPQFRGRK
jgi:tagatose-1,6-bisphosphate aldolase